MDLTNGDMLIFSGEGETGTWERYEGARTVKAIKARLTRERCHGDRWATANIELPGRDDGSGNKVYGKLGPDLDAIVQMRSVPESEIRVNPGSALRAIRSEDRAKASRTNGAKGGRPRNAPSVTGYVYAVDGRRLVATISGPQDRVERYVEDNYDTETHGLTYSPAFSTVSGLIECNAPEIRL